MENRNYNYTFDHLSWWFVIGVFSGMLGIWASIYFGRHTSNDYREKFEKEAVTKGHASWVVDTNKQVIFKWNSEK